VIVVAPALRGLLAQKTKRLAKAWKITRADGEVLRFTSASKTLRLVDGQDYSPASGIAASAARREAALAKHDLEFRGVVTSERITADDLAAHRYDEAEVYEYLVDWAYAWAGNITTTRYWISGVTWSGETWSASVEGFTRWLEAKIGDKYARPCRHTLGDAATGGGCSVNLASFTVTGVVAAGTLDGERRRIIRATTGSLSGAFPDGYFAHGRATCTSGANDGITRDVKGYTSATRDIELQLPFPHRIAAADEFSLVAGCNGLKTTCIVKFANFDDFGGYEFMPGSDRILRIRPK